MIAKNTSRFCSESAYLALLFAALCIGSVTTVYGQAITNGTNNGFPENAVIHGTDIENVQVTNGNLHIEAPIWSAKGRGVDTGYKLLFNSKNWSLAIDCSDYTGLCNGYAGGPAAVGVAGPFDNFGIYSDTKSEVCNFSWASYSEIKMENIVLQEADGTKHHLSPDPVALGREDECTRFLGLPAGVTTFYADDGSGWVATGTPDGNFPSVTRKDGTTFTGGKIMDSNGNFIFRDQSTTPWTQTDALGRTFNTDGSYKDSSGALRGLTITNTTAQVTSYMCGFSSIPLYSCTEWTSPISVPQTITLPNGMSYSFQYNSYDPRLGHGGGGEPSSMTLPTGATISWIYGDWDWGGRPVTSRTVTVGGTSGTWTYAGSSGGNPYVVDPQGTKTSYTCLYPTGDNRTDPCFPTQEQIQDVSGQVLKTTTTDYVNYSWDQTLLHRMVLPIRETIKWNQQNQVSKVETDWDLITVPNGYGGTATFSWKNPVQRREYDWGTGAPGALLRTTAYNYKHLVDSNYRSRNIADRPISVTVYDGGGNPVAQTLNSYDSTTLLPDLGNPPNHDSNYSTSFYTRGNLTQVQKWLNPGNTYITTATNNYDDLGNLRSTTNALNHTTTFDYSDNWWGPAFCVPSGYNTQAYVRQVTNELFLEKYDYYYPCTGLLAHTRDPNDLAASRNGTIYTYDLMNRPLQVTHNDGGQTTYSYVDSISSFSPQVHRQDKIDTSGNVADSFAMFDGLGRLIRTAKTNGEGGANIYDQVDTCYDGLGRKSFQSYPYQGAGWNPGTYHCPPDSSTPAGDSYTYDALGRATRVTHLDGGFVSTDYSQFPTVTVTDEASRARKNKTDALGRLLAVWEPDPATGTGFPNETDYQYDTLDNLLCVHQKGSDTTADKACSDSSVPAAWRPRVFSYDSLSRLLTATNPESGTICYGVWQNGQCVSGYDNAGNLIHKTSPAPNQGPGPTVVFNYSYDAINRLTGKFADSIGGVSYFYDQSQPWSVTVHNPVGRLVLTSNNLTAGGPNVGTVHSYDSMGRSEFEMEVNQRSSAPAKTFSYAYNLDSSLKSITYPSGRVVNYGYNQGQRPIWALDTNSTTYLASNAHYTAWGALGSVVDGNVTTTNYYNARMQPCRITATTGSVPTSCTDASHTGNVLDLKYDFQLGQADNGNVYGITNNKATTRSQTFNYDYLNRLKQAWTSNSTLWGTAYGYDIWGNLLQKTTFAGYSDGDPQLNVSIGSNNQVTTWCYDGAGNVLKPGSCIAPLTNTFDGENRLVSTTTGSVTTNYDYDADGRRVKKSGSTNTLYWYGPGNEVLEETDPTGTFQHDYVFFGGKRISRLDAAATNISANVVSTQGLAGNVVAITVSSTQTSYFTPGARVFVTGLTTSTFLNDQVFTITSVDTSQPPNITFQVSFTHPAYSLTTDTGTVTVGLAAPPIYHYFSDHLGSADVVTDASGAIKEESDYYPFGGERVVTDLLIGNNYKFTGKERDPETGCDYFGARYYCNTIGRFITPDWAAAPTAVPYANFGNPQSLNLYSYVQNNPTTIGDPDGHCGNDDYCDTAIGAAQGTGNFIKNAAIGIVQLVGAAFADFPQTVPTHLGELLVPPVVTAVQDYREQGASGVANAVLDQGAQGAMSIVTEAVLTGGLAASGRVSSIRGVSSGSGALAEAVVDEPHPSVIEPYQRPSGATTAEQRASVQGKPCVDCGSVQSKMVANHKTALVKEYYKTGTIDKARMRSKEAVDSHCTTCSAKEGARMSQYSKRMKAKLKERQQH